MEQLFGSIPSVIGGFEPHQKIDEAIVFAAWSRSAGEMLRERTLPVEFNRNRLVIAVSDKMWQRHLEELCPQMLVKMNAALGHGTVRFIEFQIDEKAVKRAHENRESKSNIESNIVTPELAAAAMAIADENLRKNFLEAAVDYLAKQNSKKFEI